MNLRDSQLNIQESATMPRVICFLLGLSLAFAPLISSSRTGDPTPSELSIARGGNPGIGKKSLDCDKAGGQYVGCTVVNGNCQQCGKTNDDGTFTTTGADFFDFDPPEGETGSQYGTGRQDCGELYMGLCVADSSSPTGFNCVLAALNIKCTGNYSTIVPQNSP